jgi:hypothetical protein
VVRTHEITVIRSTIRTVNSHIVVYEVHTLNSIISRSLAARCAV